MLYRYSRWDGSQEVDPFSADELMEALRYDRIATGPGGAELAPLDPVASP